MSRIGKLPIAIPAGVDVKIEDHLVQVKGPKGVLSREIHQEMNVKVEEGKVLVERPSDSKTHRSLHGLSRTLVANMVEGVTNGYQKKLQAVGVGWRAELDGSNLVLSVGLSHQVRIEPRTGITFEVGQDQAVIKSTTVRVPLITVTGIDKEVVGQQAAEIRKVRPPEPYLGKGIKYQDEIIRRKAGKQAGKK